MKIYSWESILWNLNMKHWSILEANCAKFRLSSVKRLSKAWRYDVINNVVWHGEYLCANAYTVYFSSKKELLFQEGVETSGAPPPGTRPFTRIFISPLVFSRVLQTASRLISSRPSPQIICRDHFYWKWLAMCSRLFISLRYQQCKN